MKVAFLQSENENLAVEYLSAVVMEAGHQAVLGYDHRYFDRTAVGIPALARLLDAREMLAASIAAGEPDLVCFSVMTSDYQWALDMAARLKRLAAVPVLFGGVHAVSVPEVVIAEEQVDMVCDGEGERALLLLLEQLGAFPEVDVPGVWVKSEGDVRRRPPADLVSDLDSLPLPDKEIFYRQLPWLRHGYLMISGRGCPYACTFCGNDVLRRAYKGRGRYVRRRSVEGVIDEIVRAYSMYRPSRFNILDDCFTADKEWLAEFCERYRARISVPFICLSHPQLVDDDVGRMLSEAGCFQLLLGIQSASEATRREVLNRPETNERIVEAAAVCHRHGIRFSIDHIFGIPGEGAHEYREALEFYSGLRPSIVNTYWLIYFPRTKIVETALREGLVSPEDLPLMERGLFDTSMNVGLGRGDRAGGVPYSNYAFLYGLIPLMSARLLGRLAERLGYLERLRPPLSFAAAARMLAALRIGVWKIYREQVFGILAGFARSAVAVGRFRLLRERKPQTISFTDE
ncbi:MAG: radical SAM protein [Actinobacteria bacterium]|nr:radical SAM protein [Actinomycetota bacterium]MBU1942225.1 radical SAM protein [Actinomycetota bacterium]MBU2687426.1 radical SAM protein [Actinomycetota bacterium]